MATRLALIAAILLTTVAVGIFWTWQSDRGEDLESIDDRLDFADSGPPDSSPEPAGGALDRIVCDNPLYWGQQGPLGTEDAATTTVPAVGAHSAARVAADTAVLVEQPGLTDYAEVTERVTDSVTQFDYVVSGGAVAVITVVPRSIGWDFQEALLCEAHAAIVPPELDTLHRRLNHISGVTLRNVRCVNERGVAHYGIDAWPGVAARPLIDPVVDQQVQAFVAECGP